MQNETRQDKLNVDLELPEAPSVTLVTFQDWKTPTLCLAIFMLLSQWRFAMVLTLKNDGCYSRLFARTFDGIDRIRIHIRIHSDRLIILIQ